MLRSHQLGDPQNLLQLSGLACLRKFAHAPRPQNTTLLQNSHLNADICDPLIISLLPATFCRCGPANYSFPCRFTCAHICKCAGYGGHLHWCSVENVGEHNKVISVFSLSAHGLAHPNNLVPPTDISSTRNIRPRCDANHGRRSPKSDDDMACALLPRRDL